jgi:hypothetical protein
MRCVTVISALSCLLIASIPAHSQSADDTCTSRFASRQLGPKLVSAILVDHQAWFAEALENKARFDNSDPRRANLSRAGAI